MRGLVAVIALYGLLLQGFFAQATPLGPDLGLGILCADHTGGTPDSGQAARHDHACCVAAQPSLFAPPPGAAGLVLPVRYAALVQPARPEAERLRTGPPPSANSPRGPPTA